MYFGLVNVYGKLMKLLRQKGTNKERCLIETDNVDVLTILCVYLYNVSKIQITIK